MTFAELIAQQPIHTAFKLGVAMHGYYGHYRSFYDRDAAVTRSLSRGNDIGGDYDEVARQQDLDAKGLTNGRNTDGKKPANADRSTRQGDG